MSHVVASWGALLLLFVAAVFFSYVGDHVFETEHRTNQQQSSSSKLKLKKKKVKTQEKNALIDGIGGSSSGSESSGDDSDELLRRELCLASSLTAATAADSGDRYFLVGSSHDLERAIPTDEPVSFLFHRSSPPSKEDDSEINDADPCSLNILETASTLLNERTAVAAGNELLPEVPLSQSAFLQVYIDHRYGREGVNLQTRRVEIDVVEIAQDYFYFQTHLSGSSGIAVLSLEVEFESRSHGFRIPLDTLGSSTDCAPFDDPVVDQVLFRYQTVARFGVFVERAAELEDESGVDERPCDYSNGGGEWVFELKLKSVNEISDQTVFPVPDSVLDDITSAPSKNAKIGHYRLFSCSMSTLNRDFENGKETLRNAEVCSLGDSNFVHMEPVFKRHLPKFHNSGYFFRGHDFYGDMKVPDVPVSKTPRCSAGRIDVMLVDHGSHCPSFNMLGAEKEFNYVDPNITKQADCVLGIDELEPFSKLCPETFGDIERLRRNVWRVTAKNRIHRDSYSRNNALVGALDPMSLSIRDVAMHDKDCVHYTVEEPFPFYAEAVKYMIALAGRDCPQVR